MEREWTYSVVKHTVPLASKNQSNFRFRISLRFWRPTFYYLELLRLPGVTQPSNSVKKEIKFKKIVWATQVTTVQRVKMPILEWRIFLIFQCLITDEMWITNKKNTGIYEKKKMSVNRLVMVHHLQNQKICVLD